MSAFVAFGGDSTLSMAERRRFGRIYRLLVRGARIRMHVTVTNRNRVVGRMLRESCIAIVFVLLMLRATVMIDSREVSKLK